MGVALFAGLPRSFYWEQCYFQTCYKNPDRKLKLLFACFHVKPETESFKKLNKTFSLLQHRVSKKILELSSPSISGVTACFYKFNIRRILLAQNLQMCICIYTNFEEGKGNWVDQFFQTIFHLYITQHFIH